MVAGLVHIKINGNKNNKANGLYSLMLSGSSVMCLKDEEYIVEEGVTEKIEKENIDFNKVEKREGNSEGEQKENAKRTKI